MRKTTKVRGGGQVIKRGRDIRRREREVKKCSERSNQRRFSQSEENSLRTVRGLNLSVDHNEGIAAPRWTAATHELAQFFSLLVLVNYQLAANAGLFFNGCD